MYNPSQHHRKSIRLKGYDYSKKGLYFLTICTQGSIHLFGKIENGKMILNDGGKIVDDCWLAIPEHFPNVVLHEFIVMPNHVHGIIELKNLTVAVENFQPLGIRKQHKFQKIIPRSIGSIVRGFKIGVTKYFRNHNDIKTVWQRNYYDIIIRDKKSYKNISNYIKNNPASWENDKFNN